jgi:hypothetical protein
MSISFSRLITCTILVVLSLATGFGCGSEGAVAPTLIAVKGKVTFKGQPVTKGTIRFAADGYGRDAAGFLKADGSYELTTHKAGDGVTAGEHRVYITEVDPKLAKDRALKKFTSPNTSKLVAEVTPEKTEHDFDLR